MTTSPAPPAVKAPSAMSVADGSASDGEELDPLTDESRVASDVPYISLLARAKVLEQVTEGLQRRNSLINSSRRGSMEKQPVERPKQSKAAQEPQVLAKKLPHELCPELWGRRARRPRQQHQQRRCQQEHPHRARDARLVGAPQESRRAEALEGDPPSAESVRIASEIAAASAPLSPRAGSKNYDSVVPVEFARGDLDLLVVWARKLQTKTFPRGVDDTSIRETMKYLRFRQYQDGEALFFEGEIGEIFYFLFQGTVVMYVDSSKSQLKNVEGTRRTARILEKPDLKQLGKRVFTYRIGEGFRETAMFTNDAIRTASAIAVGACEVCELLKEIYKRTLKKYHQQFFEQSQKINFIQRVSLFKDWQRQRLSTVADVLEKQKLAFRDHLLVGSTAVLTSCFFVLSGLVKITKHIDIAPPPFSDETNQSAKKKPKHQIQMNIELQTLGGAEIVALEALTESNKRVTYNAVAASADVELYALKEVDARSFLGSMQSSLCQRIREMCMNEKSYRNARLETARHTFHEQEALKKDADMLRSQDDFAEVE